MYSMMWGVKSIDLMAELHCYELFFVLTSTGEVEITLRNRGPDAFHPELYGPSIRVNRKFSSDGGSQYKLKSKDGKNHKHFRPPPR